MVKIFLSRASLCQFNEGVATNFLGRNRCASEDAVAAPIARKVYSMTDLWFGAAAAIAFGGRRPPLQKNRDARRRLSIESNGASRRISTLRYSVPSTCTIL